MVIEKIKNSLRRKPLLRMIRNKIHPPKADFKPGHYYSPISSKEKVLKRQGEIFDIKKKEIDGIDLNEVEQLSLLEEIKEYYSEIPFEDNKKNNLRYYFNNGMYLHGDGVFLYSIIRHFKPKKVIEVGSGFSSALILDTNELFFKNNIQCSFIDPYLDRLLLLLNDDDKKKHNVISKAVQDVKTEFFKQLEQNDILFIDSSHVSKTGSDVNYILFNILPALNSGVIVHFHDIFYPFEYPKKWFLMGLAWNEAYLLRAFLQYNSKFKILLYNAFLGYRHREWFKENMPLCLRTGNGYIWTEECSSIWLKKA